MTRVYLVWDFRRPAPSTRDNICWQAATVTLQVLLGSQWCVLCGVVWCGVVCGVDGDVRQAASLLVSALAWLWLCQLNYSLTDISYGTDWS